MEKIEELRELSIAVEKAVKALVILRQKARRHIVKGVKPKRQLPIVTVEIEKRPLSLTDRQVVVLIALKNSGGVETLTALSRSLGLDTRLGLGLAEQLAETGLVKLVAAPQRKILILTQLGWKTVEAVERVLEKRGGTF
ncbi:MAG: hypothetical protein N3E41_05785 [Thermofilaceae archaeon]|nr:hypothetical protein [Thermofilaceae archaeon]